MTPPLRAYATSLGLGLTQMVGYGALMYAYAVLLPIMAQDLGLSLATAFGILSLGLFFGGLLSPLAGMLVDRFGGRYVMALGSIAAGIAVMLFSLVTGRYGLFFAVLLAETAAMFVLHNVAVASLVRLQSPLKPGRAISVVTLFGGLSSTLFWPLTLWLANTFGWETAWVVLGLMVLLVCTPIHYIALRGPLRDPDITSESAQADWPPLPHTARRRAMVWMILSFVCSGYLLGAVMTLWVTNAQDLGHTAAAAALAGAVIGPFKTIGRLFEMTISRSLYPLVTYALSLMLMGAGFFVILLFGFSFTGLVGAAALYGMGVGIKTIARATVPLALFGPKGYGARLGWISFVDMALNASAPFAFAWITQTYGGWWSFGAMAFVLCGAAASFAFIPDPRKTVS